VGGKCQRGSVWKEREKDKKEGLKLKRKKTYRKNKEKDRNCQQGLLFSGGRM